MIRTKSLLLYYQSAPIERFGLAIESLIAVESSKVIEADRCRRMISAKRLLIDCQGALVERFGLNVQTLSTI